MRFRCHTSMKRVIQSEKIQLFSFSNIRDCNMIYIRNDESICNRCRSSIAEGLLGEKNVLDNIHTFVFEDVKWKSAYVKHWLVIDVLLVLYTCEITMSRISFFAYKTI